MLFLPIPSNHRVWSRFNFQLRLAHFLNAGGRWNTYEITADDSRLVVTLNGTRTVDIMHDEHREGPFALQYGAGVVKFRNVRIRPL